MNIRQAKDYIKDSVRLYLKKDEEGEYRIPVMRQRPIFLLGAPGIGKTAIMEQIAQELGIAIVSYSMTHHTRQSALGLPVVEHKMYGGMDYDVSEYTMSEIIASIYDTMQKSGVYEGILFLDEINCVSETLAPSMLQFLQYKVFGRHKVPEGWVIVTAGNPPEYNKSVRDFDVVTYDRLRVLEVEADYDTWKLYAREKGLHTAILNFLEIHKDYFYHMETTVKGRRYVTARGWEDLAGILALYEEENLPVDETLVGQYLRSDKIIREFTAYYDLYNKYKKDYRVDEILAGKISDIAVERAKSAPFDERLSLLGMLLDRVMNEIRDNAAQGEFLTELVEPLKALQNKTKEEQRELLILSSDERRERMEKADAAGALSARDKKKALRVIQYMDSTSKMLGNLSSMTDWRKAYEMVREDYGKKVDGMKKHTARIQEMLHAMFTFTEQAFADGNEMLILVTELTVNSDSSAFIARFGCPDYRKHNEQLMFSERSVKIADKIKKLEL